MNHPWLFGTSMALLLSVASNPPVLAQMIVGHRGASADAPENTLAAFELAWQQGADAVEGDFYLTADGEIVCIHDADTERTTGVRKVVAETTLDELRQLDAGSWKHERFRGQKIPTFEEVLRSIPAGKRFVIELKTGPEIVPPLARQLERLGPKRNRLLIIAFDPSTIEACKQQLHDIEAHWLTSFKERDEGDGVWKPTAEEIATTIRQIGADGVGMNGKREVIDRQFVERLRSRGCEAFHVWTINSPEDARFFRQLGAVAITTDRPGLIREALEPAATK